MNDEILVALAGTVGVGTGLVTKNGWIIAFTIGILVIYLIVSSSETHRSPSASPSSWQQQISNESTFYHPPMRSFQHQIQPKSLMLPQPESVPTTRTDPVLGVPAATTQFDLLHNSAISMSHQPSPLENMGHTIAPPCIPTPLEVPSYAPIGKGTLLNPYMSKGDPRIWTPNVNDLVQDRMAQYGEQDCEFWRDHRKFLDARVKFARFQTADGSFGGKRDKYTRDPPNVAAARKAAESVQPILARRQPLPSF